MTEPSTKILLDCDTGIDDALAILYGAANGADYLACTITHGNVPVELGAENTLRVLDLLGLHTPVWVGAARPMAQALRTAPHVHGDDGLGNTSNPLPTRTIAGDLAPAEIVRLARAHPRQFTLVPVGPLTNIGLALLLEPRLPELIDKVYVMGGAVGFPGNASELGEANVLHDPEAAQLVVEAPWDVVFVGLEITMKTALGQEQLDRIQASDDPRAKFAWNIMQFYMRNYTRALGRPTCVLHDAVALALALDPGLATYQLLPAYVDTSCGRSRGALVGDQRAFTTAPSDPATPGTIRIVSELDVATFHERFLTSLGA